MPAKKPDPSPAPVEGRDAKGRRVITDAKAMRAMAHPTRLALLELIRSEGEITASQAAELLDDSPGNMSWHLQTLGKYGFIEEAPGAKGRSRPWKIASLSNRFRSSPDDPSALAAGQALQMTVIERNYELTREWWSHQQSFAREWRDAAFMTDSVSYVTPEEMAELAEQLTELLMQFNDRIDEKLRPEGAIAVHFNAQAHPLVPKGPGR
jgi:DNA-binding transcriptional ArsR family regulator